VTNAVATNTEVPPPVPPPVESPTVPPATAPDRQPGPVAAAPPSPPANPTKGFDAVTNTGVERPAAIITPPYGEVLVLSIGVNGAGGAGLATLRFADSDARAFSEVLGQRFGFTNVVTLTNEQGTRENIVQALARLQETARQRQAEGKVTDVLVFFSGHGTTVRELRVSGGRTNEVRHGFLVTHDSTLGTASTLADLRARAVEMVWLAERMKDLPARHRLVFLDACFSGLAYVTQAVVDRQVEDLYPEIIARPTVQIMTAGLDQEFALEDAEKGHGVFTLALLEELRGGEVQSVDELFFPVRVSIRERLRQMNASGTMTPQHRFLVYQNGTFVFVPPDKLSAWAAARPSNPQYAQAGSKGYFRPVEITEVTNVVALGTMPPARQSEVLDRYEARAAMGDPNATLALAQIYQGNAGIPADEKRARLYASETADLITAQGTLNIAGLLQIENPVVATLVNNLVRFDSGGATGNPFAGSPNAASSANNAVGLAQILGIFGGGGGAPGMEGARQDILKLLDQRKYRDADRRLSDFERQLTEVIAKLPTGAPPELAQIQERIKFARRRIEINVPGSARKAVEDLGPLIQNLMQFENKPNP